jgi:hypothetical protein
MLRGFLQIIIGSPRVGSVSRFIHSSRPLCKNDEIDKLRKKAQELHIDPKVLADAEKLLMKPIGESTKKITKSDQTQSRSDTRKPPESWRKMKLPEWKRHKYALWEKFDGQAWNPGRKLSRDQMDSVRVLKSAMPNLTASDLAKEFRISPEAVSKILKSRWKPLNDEEADNVRERWLKRKDRALEIMGSRRNKDLKLLISSGEFTGVRRASLDYLKKKEIIKKGEQKGDPERLFKFDKITNKKKNMF